jgi:hypothetical protein
MAIPKLPGEEELEKAEAKLIDGRREAGGERASGS